MRGVGLLCLPTKKSISGSVSYRQVVMTSNPPRESPKSPVTAIASPGRAAFVRNAVAGVAPTPVIAMVMETVSVTTVSPPTMVPPNLDSAACMPSYRFLMSPADRSRRTFNPTSTC